MNESIMNHVAPSKPRRGRKITYEQWEAKLMNSLNVGAGYTGEQLAQFTGRSLSTVQKMVKEGAAQANGAA